MGNLFGIAENRRYLTSTHTPYPYSRERIESEFGKGIYFDFVVDTSGDIFNGEVINNIILEIVEKGGVFCTTYHKGISNVDAGHPQIIGGMKRFVNGLSPMNNFPYATSFLSANHQRFRNLMSEIPGGLSHPDIAQIVATGGSDYKKTAYGITFFTQLVEPGKLLQFLKT